MIFEIKHRWTGEVLFSLETSSLKLAVEAAVKQRVSLLDADLSDANLRAANLRAANLSDADLSDADLSDANLRAANLSAANLSDVRDDLWAVLSSAPKEVEGLRDAVIAGKIDGTVYDGECACLVGTIANLRHCSVDDLGVLKPDSDRPAERFFLAIRVGDAPENSQPSKLVLAWIDEWLRNVRGAFSTAPATTAK